MGRHVVFGSILAFPLAFLCAISEPSWAGSSTISDQDPSGAPPSGANSIADVGASAADVLLDRNVINNNEDAVGVIDSVSLNTTGRVDYVVIDVSAWLHKTKLIQVPWSQLSVDSDGNVRTILTKEMATKSASYSEEDAANHQGSSANIDDIYEIVPPFTRHQPD